MAEFQLRSGGSIEIFNSLIEAIKVATGKHFDKISFTIEDNRLILYSDGSWELRTTEGQYQPDTYDEVIVLRRWLPGEATLERD